MNSPLHGFENESLVGDIYSAALVEQGWEVASQKLRKLTNRRLVSLLAHSCEAQHTDISAVVGGRGGSVVSVQHSYAAEFPHYDLMLSRLATWQEEHWMDDSDFPTTQ